MSKNEARPEPQGRFRGDAQGDRAASGSSQAEHAAAGDKLRAEVQPPTGGARLASTSDAGFFSRPAPKHEAPSSRPGERTDARRARSGEPGHIEVPPIKAVIRPGDRQQATASAAARTEQLDRSKSVEEHVRSGRIVRVEEPRDSRTHPQRPGDQSRAGNEQVEAGDRVREVERRTEAAEKVKVVYSDQANDPSERVSQADFRIKKDGTIEMLSDPERNNKKEIVVEVEREQGQISGPTEAQQKSIDELTAYLSERLMKENVDGTKAGVIEDKQGLVSDRVKAQVRTQPEPEDVLPEPTRRQINNMNRFSGGGRGTLSPEQADGYFPPREVPRMPNETVQTAALKDVVAGMLNVGEKQPYEATRQLGDRGWGVGRYMLTYDMLMAWLEDIMGDPPDPAKLEAAIKAGKISPKMAAKLQSPQFKAFMEKLKSGEQPGADEIKEFLPKELQEQVAGDLVGKFAEQSKDANGQVDVGKVALAMAIGRMPTEEEMKRPEFQSYETAAERLYSISEARTENPGQSLEWQDVNNRLLVAAKQSVGQAMWAKSGYSAALLEYGNLGCAASVSQVMKVAGVDGFKSASVTNLESQLLKAGGVRVGNPQPGDIIVGLKNGGRAGGGSGHIGIVGENGTVYHNSSARRQWVQADMKSVFYSGRFNDVHFIRLPDSSKNA